MNGDWVLIVDDDEDDLLFLTTALAREKFEFPIVVAHDGAEAMKRLEDGERLPRVAVLDLKLPKIDGIEVLRRLRADDRFRSLRVIILSASEEKYDMERADSLGSMMFLRKPTETSRYADIARRIAEAARL